MWPRVATRQSRTTNIRRAERPPIVVPVPLLHRGSYRYRPYSNIKIRVQRPRYDQKTRFDARPIGFALLYRRAEYSRECRYALHVQGPPSTRNLKFEKREKEKNTSRTSLIGHNYARIIIIHKIIIF